MQPSLKGVTRGERPPRIVTGPDAALARLIRLGNVQERYVPSADERAAIAAAHARLRHHLAAPQARIYGIHTGYGADIDSARDPLDWQRNQLELLTYLCVGVGPALPDRVVRRALRLQAMKVARGLSGLHPDTHADLLALADQPCLPAVPCYGSLGASGDLIPMAHAIAPLFATTLSRAPRDVLCLVNTNAMMSSLALECLEQVWELHHEAIRVTAAASLALGLRSEHFDPKVLALNTHQLAVTQAGGDICLARERLAISHASPPQGAGTPVQERYSVRCAPQVLGNAAEGLRFAGERILAEALSVADNPIVLEDGMWHGGLFYAAGLATAADLMHDAVARTAEMVDRQVLLLVTASTSHGLPENLASPGALHVKGIHQLLSALNQSLRGRAVPARQMSFSCEGNNQDIVPCGMAALLALDESLALARQAMRAAAFCAERALCLRAGMELPAALSLAAWNEYDVRRLT